MSQPWGNPYYPQHCAEKSSPDYSAGEEGGQSRKTTGTTQTSACTEGTEQVLRCPHTGSGAEGRPPGTLAGMDLQSVTRSGRSRHRRSQSCQPETPKPQHAWTATQMWGCCKGRQGHDKLEIRCASDLGGEEGDCATGGAQGLQRCVLSPGRRPCGTEHCTPPGTAFHPVDEESAWPRLRGTRMPAPQGGAELATPGQEDGGRGRRPLTSTTVSC